MTDAASELNATLEREAPALARCLSPLGRLAAFPRGIPYQADEARSTQINATIGQLTDGRGDPMPLTAMVEAVGDLDRRETFLYASVEGPVALRRAWLARQRRLASPGGAPTGAASLPLVTHGLTHGISLVAELFADPDTDVIVPAPAWENYELLFGLHAGARVTSFPFFRPDGAGFDVEGLAAALERVRTKAVVVLNFPGNPTGYTPTRDEAARIVEVLTAWRGPGVVVLDDAYQGWVYEDGLQARSIFWDLAERADPERLAAIKIDGATKELLFFSSRIGFLTASVTPAAEEALLSKLKYFVRGTVGSASGPAMSLIRRALADDRTWTEFEDRRLVLARRYRALKSALADLPSDRLVPCPFNSAFFALLRVGGSVDAEELRTRLIRDHSVGTIAFREENAIRLAYCSIHEDQLPELVRRLAKSVGA